jgi:hypothetical protein
MKKQESKPSKCGCSCCEEELKDGCMEPEFCTPCSVVFIKCKKCGAKISDKVKVCAECGTKI